MNDFTWSEQIAHRDVLGISDHDEEAWKIFESKPNFPTIRLLVSVIHHITPSSSSAPAEKCSRTKANKK